jgi:hypothetical protein
MTKVEVERLKRLAAIAEDTVDGADIRSLLAEIRSQLEKLREAVEAGAKARGRRGYCVTLAMMGGLALAAVGGYEHGSFAAEAIRRAIDWPLKRAEAEQRQNRFAEELGKQITAIRNIETENAEALRQITDQPSKLKIARPGVRKGAIGTESVPLPTSRPAVN